MKKITISLLLSFFIATSFAQYVTTLAGPNTGINDALSVDSKGNIYGSYYNGAFNGSSIYKVTPEGNVTVFADGFTCTNGSVFDEDDNLYVINVGSGYQNQIYKVTPDGEKSPHGPIIYGAAGITKDPESDTLYIGGYPSPTIGKLAPDGTYEDWVSGAGLNGPVGMTFDEEGNLYTANYANGKVFKIENGTTDIIELADVPGTSFGSVGFLIYSRGYLWATGIGKHKIYRISLEGEIMEIVGTGNSGSIDGAIDSARFANPNGIALSLTGDSLIVSDYSSQTIRIITDYDKPIETSAPIIDSVVIETNNKISVYFNERLESNSAKNKDNYLFSNDVELNVISLHTDNFSFVELHISNMDLSNEELSLSVSNILDVHNNAINDTTIYFNTSTSISENNTIILSLFPNPVYNGLLNIKSNKTIQQVMVVDSNGRVVIRKQFNINNIQLNLDLLNRGLYSTITTHSDGSKSSAKFVK